MHATTRIRYFREAGYVRRFHTVPIIGEYTVGKHSYDALSILLVLHPCPTIPLVKALLWHDSGERWLGDVPSPAKGSNPHFAKIYERMEDHLLNVIGALPELTEEDRIWLRAIDKVELWLYCQEQIYMGNRNVENSCAGVYASIINMASVPAAVLEFMHTWITQRSQENSPVGVTSRG